MVLIHPEHTQLPRTLTLSKHICTTKTRDMAHYSAPYSDINNRANVSAAQLIEAVVAQPHGDGVL